RSNVVKSIVRRKKTKNLFFSLLTTQQSAEGSRLPHCGAPEILRIMQQSQPSGLDFNKKV
ncbi:hypothetical protein IKE99_01565, partial [Candidatus Saccharibacteria bacterium]|nr:hypothetical protein [Candidatus Saccharibacteria bacterium]